ncbi:MAG: MerR family transcriptional regulator [Myxococcota bacterium]
MTQRTVKEVARLTGVTVRTLHHYDDIGLLPPTHRTEAGYRLYGEAEVARLHNILLWRSLGFPLEEVRALLDDPGHDAREAMVLHRERLVREVGALHERLQALDQAIARHDRGDTLRDDDLVALFDGFDPADYAEEAEAQWGGTEPYREAQRRTRGYGAPQWAQIKAEGREVDQRLASLLAEGSSPDSAEARSAADSHRAHISRWFYACTPEIHLGLADLYESDPRFRSTYEATAEGLTDFLVAAIRALHAPRHRML